MSRVCYRNARAGDSRSQWLPWQWCNLRRNPFGELTRSERVSLAVVDVSRIASQLDRPRTAVQFIGEAGHGKTTRLLKLHSALNGSSYVYLPEDQPCPAIAWGTSVLIDEAQRLPRPAAKQVLSSGLPLAVATHRDLSRMLESHGYQVTTHPIGHDNDAKLLCEVTTRRIEASRLDVGTVPSLRYEDAQKLIDRFGTNFRAIEGYLYELIQKQCYSHGEVRFID